MSAPRYTTNDYNRTDTLSRRQAIARMPMERAEPRVWWSVLRMARPRDWFVMLSGTAVIVAAVLL